MRVLQILSSSGFHGSEAMAAELVRQLHALGVTVDVAVFDNGGRGDRRILDAVGRFASEGIVVPCRGQFDWTTVAFLRRYLATRRLDVVHSHKYKTTFYSLLARRQRPCRLVVTYHNWLTDTVALKAYAMLDKRLVRYCDAAVGVSTGIVDELRRYAGRTPAVLVENGVDIGYFRRTLSTSDAKRALGLPPDRPAIGFVGRLSAAKGVSFLLQAVHRLALSTGRGAQVIIVGDGDYRSRLESEAAALGLSDRVHFLGTRADTLSLYSALDLFVLPSEQEAFPMVVLEAMACGVPVIATDVGDVRRMIDNGVSGRIVPKRDAEALRAAICDLLDAPELALRFGAAARDRVEREFSSSRMARRYLAIYGRTPDAGER